MFDITKTEKEYYESQTKEQLIIFLLGEKHEIKLLKEKLNMITGCSCFGDCDSMNGSCIDCYYDNPTLQMLCSQFQDKFTRMLREKGKEVEK